MAVRIHYRPGLLHSYNKRTDKKQQQQKKPLVDLHSKSKQQWNNKKVRSYSEQPMNLLFAMFSFFLTHLTVEQERKSPSATSDIFNDTS